MKDPPWMGQSGNMKEHLMKLTVTIVDEREKPTSTPYYTGRPSEREEYERVNLFEAVGSARITAGMLRTIADEIDPRDTSAKVGVNPDTSITWNQR